MPTKTGNSSFWKIAIALLILVVAGAFLLENYLRPVAKVETVIGGDAVDAKPGSVAVKEEYSMEMKSAVAGRVLGTNYHLDVGQDIHEGDILVQLDTSDIQIAIDQDKNVLESTKQRIAVGSSQQLLLDSAQSDFINTERLFKMGQVSDSDYQKARRAVETIQKALALEKVANEESENAEQTQLRTDESAKTKMTIRAPFDGEVSHVDAHPGDLITVGSTIVTLITTTRLVEAKISEEDFANIKPGQKAVIIFLPYGEWRYNGVVKKILPTADPETQRHLIDLTVTDIEPEKLIPGITGEVTIETGRHTAKAIIPRRALLNENVYVVKDGRVELRPVKKGYVWLTGAEITDGLAPGDQVIVEDLQNFRDGDRVKTLELPSDAIKKAK